ncbi:hypothetical protein E2C01_063051 [Portunus trituberculatus]|uniref:Uncharacterized protein n=1 Tax=Portunus trituberculatus TaxID=210409 RepID=A0A5B7H869_PORTR|nr:hypothetical protein [Portunus trituberculatus]
MQQLPSDWPTPHCTVTVGLHHLPHTLYCHCRPAPPATHSIVWATDTLNLITKSLYSAVGDQPAGPYSDAVKGRCLPEKRSDPR